jgi:hypothetical protein
MKKCSYFSGLIVFQRRLGAAGAPQICREIAKARAKKNATALPKTTASFARRSGAGIGDLLPTTGKGFSTASTDRA